MLSIIIPVFNRKQCVAEMIKCIISQTFADWELLLVDDGSTDDTFEMMLKYATVDKRIKVIRRDRLPKGGSTCRNIGLEKADGEYLIFFDSDDLISLTCLENRVHFMNENKNVDFGIFRARSFQNSLDLENARFSTSDYTYGIDKNVKNPISKLLRGEYPFVVCTNIYRKVAIQNKNIKWDEKMSVLQDIDFNLDTLFKGLKYAYADYTDFDYFVRVSHDSNSVSSNLSDDIKYNSAKYFINKTLLNIKLSKSKEYKNDFWGFILFYFNRIINDKIKVKDYLLFCSNYYSKFRVSKLNFILTFSYLSNKYNYNKKVIVILQYFLFPKLLFKRKVLILIKKSNLF